MRQAFHTRELTHWHTNERGSFDVQAGALAEAAELGDVEPVERHELQRRLRADVKAGGAPVLVLLDGQVRCVDRSMLREVSS